MIWSRNSLQRYIHEEEKQTEDQNYWISVSDTDSNEENTKQNSFYHVTDSHNAIFTVSKDVFEQDASVPCISGIQVKEKNLPRDSLTEHLYNTVWNFFDPTKTSMALK